MAKQTDAGEMVAGVEGLILSLAARFSKLCGNRVEAEELAQLGRIAALTATETYNPNGGAAFSTYAWSAVRNALGHEIRKFKRATVSIDDANNDDCYIDGLPADELMADERMEQAQREAQVRSIVERVKAEHYAKKPELFDAVVARLMASFEVARPTAAEAQRSRSDVTLESIAERFGCTREWVRRTEVTVKSHLATALTEVA